ncbi:hypothetical protein HDV02_002368 [Globomyces sp. JEL0801]|nr:hypothetical protein HDV02_002368 [Globomyces sp. JEL0801]
MSRTQLSDFPIEILEMILAHLNLQSIVTFQTSNNYLDQNRSINLTWEAYNQSLLIYPNKNLSLFIKPQLECMNLYRLKQLLYYKQQNIVRSLLKSKPYQLSTLELQDLFYCSVSYGFTDIVQTMLNIPSVDPSLNNQFAVRIAAQDGYPECLELLLTDSRVDPAVDNNFPVCLASQNGHLKCLEILLKDSRVDASDDDNYSIKFAASNGHTECVKILLACVKVDPTVDDNYPVCFAAEQGHMNALKALLDDPRVDPNASNYFPIRSAIVNGHQDCVNLLLKDSRVFYIPEIPVTQQMEQTPMHCRELIEDKSVDRLLYFSVGLLICTILYSTFQ